MAEEDFQLKNIKQKINNLSKKLGAKTEKITLDTANKSSLTRIQVIMRGKTFLLNKKDYK